MMNTKLLFSNTDDHEADDEALSIQSNDKEEAEDLGSLFS